MPALSKTVVDLLFTRETEVNVFRREMGILLKNDMSPEEAREFFDALPVHIQEIGSKWGLMDAGFIKDVVHYWEKYGW